MSNVAEKTVQSLPAPGLLAPSASRSGARFRVVGPAVLLGLEAGALTPFVEFSGGPMGYLASGRVCSAVLVALAVLCILLRRDRVVPAHREHRPGADWAWAFAHLAFFGIFVLLTLRLQRHESARAGIPETALWAALALAVAMTAFLAFNAPSKAGLYPVLPVRRGLAAVEAGGAFALVVPWFQACWPPLSGLAVALVRTLLTWTHGDGISGTDATGYPIVGTRRMALLVTPQCSETDAILAFWLLAVAAVGMRFRDVRLGRAVLAAAAGAGFIYLLNAVRIYVLVVVAVQVSPEACVRLAHSRLSQLAFLVVTAGLAAGPFRRFVVSPPPTR
jgi:exosortase/archaeosortase family protein